MSVIRDRFPTNKTCHERSRMRGEGCVSQTRLTGTKNEIIPEEHMDEKQKGEYHTVACVARILEVRNLSLEKTV